MDSPGADSLELLEQPDPLPLKWLEQSSTESEMDWGKLPSEDRRCREGSEGDRLSLQLFQSGKQGF